MREMKDSGVVWAGKTPNNWETIKIGHLTRRKRIKARDLGVVTAFRDGQVTLRSNRRTNGFTEATEFHGYQLIRPGQLAVHRMDAFAGAIGVSDSEGMCSPVLTVLDCDPKIDSQYLAFYLREAAKSGWIEALAKSIRERTSEFGWSELSSQHSLVPPIDDQKAIVRYLRHETSQIDLLISKKEQLIEKLLERRQALITHVVTKGLDPNAPMKESGVAWLKEIPVESMVTPLGIALTSSVVDGPHTTPEFLDEGLPFISVDAIEEGELVQLNTRLISESDFSEFRRKAKPEQGDILMGKAASIGKIARVKTNWEFAIWSPLALLKINQNEFDPRFIEYSLKGGFAQAQMQVLSSSNTQQNLSMSKIPTIKFVAFPRDKQVEISNYLDLESAQIGELIEKTKNAVALLQERRQALITQVVTGKIDVRGFAGGNS